MKYHSTLTDLKVLIRGGGEQASGIAYRLFKSHLRVALLEVEKPLAVRRKVSFCEAVWDGTQTVEGVTARRVNSHKEFEETQDRGEIPVLVDPNLACIDDYMPDVLIDATIAKRNLGTERGMAQLVIGFGPGFTAGEDVDIVIETNRGHDMGRVYHTGQAEPNTGVPGLTAGYSTERVLRAPCDGQYRVVSDIGTIVKAGDIVAYAGEEPVKANIDGIIRGMIRDGIPVKAGLKVGDVDPRINPESCVTISEKARALGGAALEAILWRFNQ